MNRIAIGVAMLLGLIVMITYDVEYATNIYIAAMAAIASVFVLIYANRTNWRKTAPGRAVMYLYISFALVSIQLSVTVWAGTEYPGRGILRLFLYLLVCIALLNMTLTIRRVQWIQNQKLVDPITLDDGEPQK